MNNFERRLRHASEKECSERAEGQMYKNKPDEQQPKRVRAQK